MSYNMVLGKDTWNLKEGILKAYAAVHDWDYEK